MTISLGLCRLDERKDVMNFIRDYWSASHVLGQSERLIDWQHRDEANGRYNFVLARDENQAVVGMLGFILASRYDPVLADDDETLWLTTWKVRPDLAHGLGLVLLRKLDSMLAPKWIGTVGLNLATRGIYQALGYHVDMLKRHYMLNDAATNYALAALPLDFKKRATYTGEARLVELNRLNFWASSEGSGLDDSVQVPRKTRAYIFKRYLLHPFYSYRAFLVSDGQHSGIVVLRLCSHETAGALRVVDYLGSPEALRGSGLAFQQLLRDSGAEYIDFYCSGLAPQLTDAGFQDMALAAQAGLVLPGHFEPFERSNVDLMFSLRGPQGYQIVCKGDADQDRPNLLKD